MCFTCLVPVSSRSVIPYVFLTLFAKLSPNHFLKYHTFTYLYLWVCSQTSGHPLGFGLLPYLRPLSPYPLFRSSSSQLSLCVPDKTFSTGVWVCICVYIYR